MRWSFFPAAAVAAGETFSTKFVLSSEELAFTGTQYTAADLGVDAILEAAEDESDDGSGPVYYISQEAFEAVLKKEGLDLNLLLAALLSDCPYDLYWYDKMAYLGMDGISIGFGYNEQGEEVLYLEGGMTLGFPVAEEFALDTYVVDPEKTGAVAAALADIESVLSEYSGAADYEKLCGYRDAICSRTDYNEEAAADRSYPYGNPWQLIWVFDGDPSTNVVCEGYAKAFQYLCDLTEFSNSRIMSRMVDGVMYGGTGAGDHMWNVVTMDDGLNYLVDVTNSDEDSLGTEGALFLAGTSEGSLEDGYSFVCYEDLTASYRYSADTRSLYTDEELTLAPENYLWSGTDRPDFGTPDLVLPEELRVIGEEAFAGDTSFAVVELGEQVTAIGERAFSGCTELKKIYIPAGTETIAENAFDDGAALLIYGEPGSAAEAYAEAKGFVFVEM